MKEKQDAYHHEDLKTELLEEGIKLVTKEGTESFSLRKLASACNVSHQAPYSHFSSKEKFIEAMQEYITARFSLVLEDSLKSCTREDNPVEKLGETYFEFFVSNPNYFHFLFGQSNISLDLTSSSDPETNYRPYEIFKSLVKGILDRNRVEEERQNDIVIALWAYIHGLTSMATMQNVKYGQDWKAKLHDFMNIFDCRELRGE